MSRNAVAPVENNVAASAVPPCLSHLDVSIARTSSVRLCACGSKPTPWVGVAACMSEIGDLELGPIGEESGMHKKLSGEVYALLRFPKRTEVVVET